MQFIDLLRYKAWADRRTLDAVASINELGACSFARQQLNHMVRVEELFRARLLGLPEPHEATNSETIPPLEELDRRLMTSNTWLQAYFAELPAPSLGNTIRFTFTDGQRGQLSREEVAFHLINHGTYHRGAIGHALDRAHVPRPADTFTVFIHSIEPERRA